ncbi:hypothetical protein NW767_000989 [Fusarium falciforme]|nr:hypothetical protein NW767_000989 [Fusarium falciforme]
MQPDDGPEPHPRRNGRGDRQDLPPPFSPEQVYPRADKAARSLGNRDFCASAPSPPFGPPATVDPVNGGHPFLRLDRYQSRPVVLTTAPLLGMEHAADME